MIWCQLSWMIWSLHFLCLVRMIGQLSSLGELSHSSSVASWECHGCFSASAFRVGHSGKQRLEQNKQPFSLASSSDLILDEYTKESHSFPSPWKVQFSWTSTQFPCMTCWMYGCQVPVHMGMWGDIQGMTYACITVGGYAAPFRVYPHMPICTGTWHPYIQQVITGDWVLVQTGTALSREGNEWDSLVYSSKIR